MVFRFVHLSLSLSLSLSKVRVFVFVFLVLLLVGWLVGCLFKLACLLVAFLLTLSS